MEPVLDGLLLKSDSSLLSGRQQCQRWIQVFLPLVSLQFRAYLGNKDINILSIEKSCQ